MKFKPLAIVALLPMAALAADDYGSPTVSTNPPSAVERVESGATAAGKAAKRETKDAWITAKVKSAIAAEKDLSARKVNIETESGVVQLFGFVDSQDQIDRAGKVAGTIEGVKSVKNDLKIDTSLGAKSGQNALERGSGEVGDAAITTKVKAAIVREKNLSALDVNVETENGVVQLGGFVDTKDQIERASKVAGKVKGVKSVKNDLKLKGSS